MPACLLLLAFTLAAAHAQQPVGTIAGVVRDESGAVIPGARITVTNTETGLSRALVTSADGTYAAAALPAGVYEVKAEAPGMRPVVRNATVATGGTTEVDLPLSVGARTETLAVSDASPQMQYESHRLDGVISRVELEHLPLNGRNFLELAKLEPGATVSASISGGANRQFQVSVFGAPSDRTRVTVDGGDVLNYVLGENALNLSQEVVAEFQISAANFDLSTGVTGAGAINIVTRSGGNEYHGSGYYFFRDHHLAAYPALAREPLNPAPFFARRQGGLSLGGPARRDRLFFFANLEHTNQDGVVTVQPRAPEFAALGRIVPSPLTGKQLSARFDARPSDGQNVFLRYSHDGNNSFTPPYGYISLPSNWLREMNWSDQSIAGLTSVLRPSVVNDARLSYTYWSIRDRLPTAADCPGDCIGLGAPRIEVLGTGLTIGHYNSGRADLRRFTATDSLTWQRGRHRVRFGGEWESYRSGGVFLFDEPAFIQLYSPEAVRAAQAPIPLPGSFRTLDDILRLPLVSFSTGIGDPRQPPLYQADRARKNQRFLFYWHDTWRARPRLTLNYGLRYSLETGAVNHDLDKPEYLAPVLGAGGLGPTRRDLNNLGPSAGLAWGATRDGKTVVRAGAGVYHDTVLQNDRLRERTIISPRGNGRFPVTGAIFPNPISGIPGVPLFQPLSFTGGPTAFTGVHLMSILPGLRELLQRHIGEPSADLTVRNVDMFKQAQDLIPRDFPMPYGIHLNAGLQRELARDLVLSADFVFRRFVHMPLYNVDYNRWESVRGPVIRACAGLEALDVNARCSTGPIGVQTPGGRFGSKGLLVKLDKRLSQRTRCLVSYALSSSVGINPVINKENWFESFGPLPTDRRHILNASGLVELPWSLTLAFISSVTSRPPFTSVVGGADFNGDGTNDDLLPGSRTNQFNRGLGKAELARLVAVFNDSRAGGRTPRGQLIPKITLPAHYEFGDSLFSQDLRLSRTVKLRERYTLTVLGEVFNLFNVANLLGHSGNLVETAAFGQPTHRVQQVFGSGGPRAFQLGARVSF